MTDYIRYSGVAYSVKAFRIPYASRTAKGVPLPQVLPVPSDAVVTSVIPVDAFDRDEEHLVLMTEGGKIKKTPLKAFESVGSRGLTVMTLAEGDSLKWARRCSNSDELIVATK